MDLVIAALLHDVVEDTPTTYEDVTTSFGKRVDRAGELRRHVRSKGLLSVSRSMAGTSAFTRTIPNSVVSTEADIAFGRQSRNLQRPLCDDRVLQGRR